MRPIVLTEGKTDKKILDTAWEKLFPEVSIPYRIISSGIQIDEELRTGSAETVRRSLEYLSTITERKIIGLFDNDREGNEQFKGLNGQIFQPYSLELTTRKHSTKGIFGILLLTPQHRNKFVTSDSLKHRYLVIEHLFSDEILEQNDMRGEFILQTSVFEIAGRKNEFSERCNQFAPNEFEGFRSLFTKFDDLLGSV